MYQLELAADCDTECYKAGCRWSTIFVFTGTTLIFLAVAHILLIVGIVSHHSRAIGMCVSSLISCVHLASIIVTGIFRFNTMGKLAALSNIATDPSDEGSHTYN